MNYNLMKKINKSTQVETEKDSQSTNGRQPNRIN